MKNEHKLCVICKNWSFDGGEPGYSEYTPGCDWSMQCYKGKYGVYGEYLSTDEFVKYIDKAKLCDDFEKADRC